MLVETRTFAVIGSVVGGAGLAALILSFASDRWLEASDFEDSGFANLGLWSICFKGKYRPPSFAAVSREYEGCWWALNKELDDLRSFLFPEWFESTQILVTVGLVLALIVAIMMVVNFINCFPNSPHKHRIKRGLALTSSLFLFLAAVLLCAAVILFGVKATETRTWIQNPDNNSLSWSFGMCILAVFLFIISTMFLFLLFIRLRADDSWPKVMFTDAAPSETNYHYTPGRNTMVSEGPGVPPAYVQRYTKNQDSHPPPRHPDSLFAVSGAGEVYINGLADYDEKRNDDYRDGYRERGRIGQPPPWHQHKTDTKKNSHQLNTSVDGTYTGSDYEKSKNIEHPVLPEYTPRSARKANEKKSESISDTETVDSVSKDEKKKESKDNNGEQKKERKPRSSSRKRRSNSRERSRSGSRSRKKNVSESDYSDAESTKKRSKHRSQSRDDSGDERSRNRRRSKRGSKKRRKSRSRSRSKSRDRDNTTYSDSQLDSDSGSVRSRPRRKHRKDSKKHSSHEDLSQKDKKRHSSSDKHKKKKSQDRYISDDKSVSEYSHQRSRKKEGRDSDVESKKRLRDFSETESVRSNRSRSKPKGTYSSYYE